MRDWTVCVMMPEIAFDGGMHVPALVNWPGHVPAGRWTREVVSTADILPTVCHVAGVAAPAGRILDGRNIWGVLTGGASSPHAFLAWANGGQLAIRKGKWKLVVNGADFDGTEAGAKPLGGEDGVFLSDLESDPGERRNLRRAHPNVVDELQTLLTQWRKDVERF